MVIVVITQSILFWYLHRRVEALRVRVTKIVEWCDVLRENEETILKDFKHLYHEFQVFQKEIEHKRD